MRYLVEQFNARGLWQRNDVVEADAPGVAAAMVGLPTFADRANRDQAYAHVAEYRTTPSTGVCSRCGSSRSSCGGERNPHE
jgi:hypothetical protein